MRKTEEDIIQSIAQDKWMMEILTCAKSLNLPDWWICAGFVRSKIWDVLHDFENRTALPDIDVIYYDQKNLEDGVDKVYEKTLNKLLPAIPWSVKNQARMHLVNKIPAYVSAVDAISKFPETATALGLKLDDRNNPILAVPHGIHDVVNFVVKPTPFFCETTERMLIYEERVGKKNWQGIWNKVEIVKLLNDEKGIVKNE